MANLASEVRAQEEQATVRRIDASSALALAAVGITERGPIGESVHVQSFAEWSKVFGGYTADNADVVGAVQGYYDNGGVDLFFTRVVHFTAVGDPTTKTSDIGTITLQTADGDETAATEDSAAQPFNMEPAQTLVIAFDVGGDQTFTFSAAAASRESGAETFDLSSSSTLTFEVNGDSFAKTFSSGEFVDWTAATAEEVVSSLNAFMAANNAGAVATATTGGTKVTITTNRRGTGASINVHAGGANGALGFTTGSTSGTGDAANIDAVTAAEVVSKLSTLTNGVASAVSGVVRLTSNTLGSGSSCQVKASSTADTAMGFDNAVHLGGDGDPVDTLQVDGKTDGEYANGLSIQVASASSGDSDRFNLYVIRDGVVRERYFNLSMDDDDDNYVETVVNDSLAGSDLIAVTDLDAYSSTASGAQQRPGNGTSAELSGGDDGLSSLSDADYYGGESSNGTTGFRCFDADDVDVLIIPGRATSAVHNAAVTYCEITRSGLCFAIFDPPANSTADQMVTYVSSTANLLELTDKAAIYWPRVKVANPDKVLYGSSPTITIAPSGHVAGIYARNDARKVGGQFEQPAGVDFGVPRNVLGLETTEVKKKAKRDIVFPKMINPISQEKGTPIFVDGARTLKSSSAWPSVGQRRGVIFVEKRLIPGLAFMRHRNIKDRLYAEGKRTVQAFLLELCKNEAFKSSDPKKAFFVDFGAALNPASVQAQHEVVARIGLATSEPAEFIILLIGPDTRALDEELAALES